MNFNRVIIRHKGPPGEGVPEGGTAGQILSVDGWVNPPAGTGSIVGPGASVNNRLVAFDGTTGALAKDSGILISEVATVALANSKEDRVAGKGLSTNDFTNALRDKLDALTPENYRGQYATLLGLTTAVPMGLPGDYAFVSTGANLRFYVWDTDANTWSDITPSELTASGIVSRIFNASDAAIWNVDNTRILTTALYDQLVESASLEYVNSLALQAGLLAPAYGQVYYFNSPGFVVPITGISNGASNLVIATPPTTLDAISTNFDSPSDGRMRYTGANTQVFRVSYAVTFSGSASTLGVVSVAKNGSSAIASRMLVGSNSTATPQSVSNSFVVSLATNDYLEIAVGNISNATDPTVLSLSISATPI